MEEGIVPDLPQLWYFNMLMIKNYLKNLLKSCLAGMLLINIAGNPLINALWENVIYKTIDPFLGNRVGASVKMTVIATAYTSDPAETDSTPFHTATGERVFDGVVAANFLDFGTRIMIPELFGNKIFVVLDRMNWRYTRELMKDHRIDIWSKNKKVARDFGIRRIEIIVLGG